MQWFTFATLIALTLVCLSALFLIKRQQDQNKEFQSQLLKENQRLTNLAASKDLSAFAALQVQNLSNTDTHVDGPVALDDASVAKLMQERYSESGLDPNLAINTDDLNDFGGAEAFRGF